MEAAASVIMGLVNITIPALIFMFINDKIFPLWDRTEDNTEESRRKAKRKHAGKLFSLILVSPIGLFVCLIAAFLVSEALLSAILVATGVKKFSDDNFMPKISPIYGVSFDAGEYGSSNDLLLLLLILAIAVAVPVIIFMIGRYCKIVGCAKGVGIFVYIAVLHMYVTSVLVTVPVESTNETVSSLVSTGSFIVMLLIFYFMSIERLEFLSQNKDSKHLMQINTLPIINFILLIILLCLEVMLEANGYLDMIFYSIILVFAVILYVASQLAYSILLRHIEERARIVQLSRESLESQEQVTLAFAEITEAKSGQTGQHVKRVSEYSRVIAQAMGLPENEVETIRIASMMHDIGKLLIPPEILEKKGKLTDEEFEIMKSHVIIGENLLHSAPGEIMNAARVIAQQHHEWWNGNGYLGMKGFEIDLKARITAVADVYDALTSNRSYKKSWYSSQAYDIIVNESGQHFDPVVVQAFVDHFDEIKAVQSKYSEGVFN